MASDYNVALKFIILTLNYTMEFSDRFCLGDEDEEGLGWQASAFGAQRLRTPRGIEIIDGQENLIRVGREDVASGALRVFGVNMLDERGPGEYDTEDPVDSDCWLMENGFLDED